MFRTCTHKDVATSLEMIGAAFAIFESQGVDAVLVSANSLFEEITEQPVLECIGRRLEEFVPRYVEKQIRACLAVCLVKQSSQETELVIERGGASRWWRLMVSPILQDNTDVKRIIVTLIEITEEKFLQQKLIDQLKHAATHDSLTGIFNRRHGSTVLNTEIHRYHRFGHALTVAMFDLDHFKTVNDCYGHACGDLVLNSVVAAVSKTLRVADTICRWGGEEFLVVLPDTVLDEALHWAERAREVLASQATIGVGEQAVKITASFGLATITNEDSTLEDLLKRADDALYRAKGNGRNQVVVAL